MWMFIGFMIFGAVSSLVSAIVRKHSTKRTEVRHNLINRNIAIQDVCSERHGIAILFV